ncbi:MAG: DUF5615 family PIN-like protein [Gemmataceae bacterium]
MADAIKYYFDEHMDPAIARGLRRVGIDCLTTKEAGHLGWDDPEQLDFATSEKRMIVTFDVDYLVLNSTGVSHAGIVWALEQKYSIGQLISKLSGLHILKTADDMLNHVEYL